MEANTVDISLESVSNELLHSDDRLSIEKTTIICTKCSKEIVSKYDSAEEEAGNTIQENIFPLNEDETNEIRMLYCNPCHLCVAVCVRRRWLTIDRLLTCASKSSIHGYPVLKEVRTYGERLLLWVLNRIVFNEYENDVQGLVFLPVPERDVAKIVWHRGRAIGFYSVKPKFSSHFDEATFRCSDIPIVDLVFVRREHRGKNLGFCIVKDVVDTFDSDIGFSEPITPPMYKVLKRFLVSNPLHRLRLWECGDCIRRNIWLHLCSEAAREAKNK